MLLFGDSTAAKRSFSHKRTAVAHTLSSPLPLPERKTLPSSRPYFSPRPSPSVGMTATSVYAARVSAGEYPHAHGYGSVSPPHTPQSATLVNSPQNNERSSLKLKILCGKSNIVNSVVIDAAGRSLYSITSTSKRTTLVECRNNVEVATVEWDRSSPRMVFRRKKVRCKEWLPLAGPETEYALLLPTDSLDLTVTSPDLVYLHMVTHSLLGCTGLPLATCVFAPTMAPFGADKPFQLLPANRPGLAIARWRIKSRSDDLRLELFQDAAVEPGLLEAIILSVVLLRSGRSFGDSPDLNSFFNSRFFINTPSL